VQFEPQGLIFEPQIYPGFWATSHAALPVPWVKDAQTLRIFFSMRDNQGRSHITYLDTDPADPCQVSYVHPEPILPLGRPGTFDDNGMMPSWIVETPQGLYLYYIGWNPQVTVSYRLAIGLAISHDGGQTFERYAEGPILDRAIDEPFFNTAPCVLPNGLPGSPWQMWYVSCTGWSHVQGHPEPHYLIRRALSDDGIHWQRTGETSIGYDAFTQGLAKPCVFVEDGLYHMIYAARSANNYRTDPAQSYRLRYASSLDGITWQEQALTLPRSPDGWDSQMVEYASTYSHQGQRFLLYNGNGFGASGFGYAVRTA
jgi:hypothetical protein